MALKPARIYRQQPNTPYTRQSQKKDSKNYISGAPAPKISIFEMGNKQGEFEKRVSLKVGEDCSIRSNALEAMRIAANSHLKEEPGVENYFVKVKVYPHHILRYHPLAGVAQADRYYEGMSRPFGRPIGRSAIVDEGQEILFIDTKPQFVDKAKKAVERAGMKIPVGFKVKANDIDSES